MAYIGNDTSDTIISGTDSAEEIYSSGINVKIYGGGGEDTITNRGYEVTIEAGAGNDTVWTDSEYSSHYNSATVDGGEGDDSIKVRDDQTSLNGGAGNDIIEVYSSAWKYNTLQGGAGNDTIYGGGKNTFVYRDGDGFDTIYYAQTNDTVRIATNSGYTSVISGSDLIVDVGDGRMTFKNAANKTLNIETETLQESFDLASFRKASAQALESFIAIGKDTDKKPADTKSMYATKVASSEIGVIRLLGKVFTEMTKYKHDANGDVVKDSNGNPVKDTSTPRTTIEFGYKAILNLDSMIKSAQKIAKGNLTASEIITETGNISKQSAELASNIANLNGNSNASSLISGIASGVGLVTNITTAFTDGLSAKEVGNILTNSAGIAKTAIKLSGQNGLFANTAFGKWVSSSAGWSKIDSVVNGSNFGTITSVLTGVCSGFDKIFKNIDTYQAEGLPTGAAIASSVIDVVESAVNVASNAIFVSQFGIDANTIFKGVQTVAAYIDWSFRSGWARLTGGDVSQVKLKTTDKTFTELIGDQLKFLFTGTTTANELLNDRDGKSYNLIKGDKKVSNFGSSCTLTTGTGNDRIFNHEGTHSNNVNAGSGADVIVVHGSNNSIVGGLGTDSLALFSDGRTPAGSNVLDGGANDDFIMINDSKYSSVPRQVKNTVIGGEGNDLIHIDDTKIPVVLLYRNGDGNDVISGYRSNDTIQIVNSTYAKKNSGNDVIITAGKGAMTLLGAKGQKLNIQKLAEDPDILPTGLSYDKNKTKLTAKTTFANEQINLSNFASTVTKVDASALNNPVNITGNKLPNSISGGKNSDTLKGDKGNDTLIGGAGNDTIYGLNDDDSIDGGKGDDFLFGGVGNDTLKGGAGNDTFVYAKGDGYDVITDYAPKTDKIKIASGKISKTTVNGKHVVLTIGSGTLTVNNAKGKTLNMIDSAGKSFSTVVGSDTLLAVTNSDAATVTANSKVKLIDASTRTKAIKITGNTLANTIQGGSKNDSLYGGSGNDSILGNAGKDKLFGDAGNDIIRGGAGNDTLTGGKGNDSLWGDAGKDTFLYSSGDGKDVIFGFETGDLLQITGTFSASYNKSKKEVAFKVGSTANAITLRDFTATSFHINGSTYAISGNNFLKK